MMGKKATEAARVFVEETGISDSLTAEDFLVERGNVAENVPHKRPHASRLIHHLHENGIPICVATVTHMRHFDLKTQRHCELFSLMHHVVRGDDPEVKQGKPSPDIFLAAANRFEHSFRILHFSSSYFGFHQDAVQVLNSLLDFSPADWGLPPFENASAKLD
ncbi:hypothetical protein R3W88_019289 [Solanum pinnatisectum]|uniref:Uncharacterized protein n=1 Tax=Solanum pinnatisectum TaxID=50273 RepID=A0AAV9KMV3_9SOLN|nr:hypothetical protein R3W88_019289 [Solanum pinnatisectum]